MKPPPFLDRYLLRNLLAVACATVAIMPVCATLPAPGGGPPMVVIDMHTHVFNAHDLPLSGIFSVHGAPVPTCDILAKLINAWTSADDLGAPLPDIEPKIGSPGELREQTLARLNAGVPSAPGSGSLFAPLSPEEHETLLEFVGKDAVTTPMMVPSAPGVSSRPQELLLVAQALKQIGFPPGESARQQVAAGVPSAPGGQLASVESVMSFLGVMMKGNLHIARQLETSEFKQVDLFVHHMMDLESAYASQPVVSFNEQILRMARLDADPQLGGKFAHFVAFDPFRRKGALDSVKSGLNAGALGIKFYPPSGYRAAGNEDTAKPQGLLMLREQARWSSRYNNLSGAELDKINDDLFQYAEDNHIPIFSHCTPHGFEADKGYGLKADPKYWRMVLNKHKKLFLCLAHSGGDGYWFPSAHPTTDEQVGTAFGKEVINLCVEFDNAYCEAGYLEKILDPAERNAFKARLAQEINKPTKDGRQFGDKLMYGTDWHMIQQEPHHEDYLSAFAEVFGDESLKSWARKFFALNAIHFIHLGEAAKKPVFSKAQQDVWKQLISNANAQ